MGDQISKGQPPPQTMYLTNPQNDNQQQLPHYRLPGCPRILTPSSLPLEIAPSHASAECYHLEVSLEEQQAQAQAALYSARKKSLPWHVGVLGWHLQKSNCYCINNKMRGLVYTEHVQHRLANFKIAGKASGIQGEEEILGSFGFNEGIYVLINALQGYRLLAEQFKVHYPTPYSIGINRKAQVKVWLHQNWALNQERATPIPNHVLIQEIISLVAERTHSQLLSQIVSSKVFYMGYDFESVLEALGQYTIEYNSGRRSLEERLVQRTRRKDSSQKRKYSLNKTRTSESVQKRQSQPINTQVPAVQITQNVSVRPLSSERRPPSHQLQKLGSPIMPCFAIPSSPVKAVRFSYQQSPQRPSSPKYSDSPTREHTNSIPLSSHPNLIEIAKKCSPLTKQSTQPKVYSSPHQHHKENESQGERDFIMKKLKISPNASTTSAFANRRDRRCQTPASLGMDSYAINRIEQVESTEVIKRNYDRAVPSFSYSEQAKSVQFMIQDNSIIYSSHSASRTPTLTPRDESLVQLTSEFRLLLQSDKKIEKSLKSLSMSECSSQMLQSISNGQSIECEEQHQFLYHKSEEVIPKGLQHQIYAIKEVDQDISYSVDQCK